MALLLLLLCGIVSISGAIASDDSTLLRSLSKHSQKNNNDATTNSISSALTLDITTYTLHFNTHRSSLSILDDWTWSTKNSNDSSVDVSVACSVKYPFICIHSEYVSTPNSETEEHILKTLKLRLIDEDIAVNDMLLDFWTDHDWSRINVLHHDNTNDADRRTLLSGAVSSDYNAYYANMDNMVDTYDERQNEEFLGGLLKKVGGALGTVAKVAAPVMGGLAAGGMMGHAMGRGMHGMGMHGMGMHGMGMHGMGGMYGMHGRGMGMGMGMGHYGGGMYGSHGRYGGYGGGMYGSHGRGFGGGLGGMIGGMLGRAMGHGMEGMGMGGMGGHHYGGYGGHHYGGMGMGMGRYGGMGGMGMGGMGGMGMGMHRHMMPGMGMGGMGMHRHMMPGMGMGGMGMGGMGMHGMGMGMGYGGRPSMFGGLAHHAGGMMADMMGGGMGHTMQRMMKMKMMMDMMGFGNKDHHHHAKKTCKYYSCIVKTQQAQLKQLMQMMMTSAMTNQAPITISDHTKHRRRMVDDETQSTVPSELTEEKEEEKKKKIKDDHVIGVQKCRMLHSAEICVTFDSAQNEVTLDYTVRDGIDSNSNRANVSMDRIDSLFETIWNDLDEFNGLNMGFDPIDFYDYHYDANDDLEGNNQFDDENYHYDDLYDDLYDWNGLESYNYEDDDDYFDGKYGDRYSVEVNHYAYYDPSDWISDLLNGFTATSNPKNPEDPENDAVEGVESSPFDANTETVNPAEVPVAESKSTDEEIEKNKDKMDEIHRRMLLFIRPLEYAITKNTAIFPEEFGNDNVFYNYNDYGDYDDYDLVPDFHIVDYTDTFILDWDDANDWKQREGDDDTKMTQCNEVILSFLKYAICIDNIGTITFEKMDKMKNPEDTDGDEIVVDEPVQAFYDFTDVVISSELKSTSLSISEPKDWSEIYEVETHGVQRKRVCNYIAMITLCVEGIESTEDTEHIWDDMKVYITYASDIQSRQDIEDEMNKEENETSGWLSWTDFFGF